MCLIKDSVSLTHPLHSLFPDMFYQRYKNVFDDDAVAKKRFRLALEMHGQEMQMTKIKLDFKVVYYDRSLLDPMKTILSCEFLWGYLLPNLRKNAF